jgi:hypothetical protein
MSMTKLETDALSLMQRADEEKAKVSAQEIILDNSNKVSFPGYPYLFEALHEKILVSIDIFKSGYECRVCEGKKRLLVQCECVTSGHPGFRYGRDELKEIETSLGKDIADAREKMWCPSCGGNPKSKEHNDICEACKGRGCLLELPDNSKNLPTTGVVVSIGSVAREKSGYKVGDRILFGPYAGTMIPTKVGLMFKVMDWYQAWCRIEGGNELAAFDFILRAE